MYLRRCCSTARRRAPPRQTMGAAACARGLGGRSSRPNWALIKRAARQRARCGRGQRAMSIHGVAVSEWVRCVGSSAGEGSLVREMDFEQPLSCAGGCCKGSKRRLGWTVFRCGGDLSKRVCS